MIRRPLFSAALIWAFLWIFFLAAFPQLFEAETDHYENQVLMVRGSIYRFEEKTSVWYVYLKDLSVLSDDADQQDKFKKGIITVEKSIFEKYDLKIGNVISCECSYYAFNTARNFGNFDEKDYYASEGIYVRFSANDIVIDDGTVDHLASFLYEFRNKIKEAIISCIKDEEISGIMVAVCTGDRSLIDDETKELFQDGGISHMLAISGLHISLLGMGLFKILRKKIRFSISASISTLFMLCFCIMCGAPASALRAFIMFLMHMTAIGLGKNYDMLCAVSLSSLILISVNPFYVKNSGFIMSHLAAVAVAVIYAEFEKFLYLRSSDNKTFITDIKKSFFLSLSINLLLLPVIAGSYYQISICGVIINLLAVPLMSFILSTGFISGIVGMISVAAGRFIVGIGAYSLYFIKFICSFFQTFEMSVLCTGNMPLYKILIFYAILFLFILIMHIWGNNSAAVKDTVDHKVRIMKILPRYLLILLCCMILLLCCVSERPGGIRISFMDVGQGDAILIESASGINIMIDGGSTSEDNVYKYRLDSAISYYGVSRIDYWIITHPDTDHISALLELLDTESKPDINIKNILIPYVPDNEKYNYLKALASEKNINFANIYEGIKLYSEDLQLTCLFPAQGYTSESVNGYSAVIELRYGTFSALFTGDLESDGEEYLLKKALGHFDLLKVSHHGSRYSSSQQFLDAVDPDYAIISAGEGNIYGHPHEETLKRLEDTGALIYCTADHGEIVVNADGMGKVEIMSKINGSS